MDTIKCGEEHSYVHTKCDRHYLFGENGDNECLVLDNVSPVLSPHCINDIITKQINIDTIIDIVPGYYNAKLICLI